MKEAITYAYPATLPFINDESLSSHISGLQLTFYGAPGAEDPFTEFSYYLLLVLSTVDTLHSEKLSHAAHARLSSYLESRHLELQNVLADGHCLYR